jgi:chromosome segregation ATPase
MDSKTPAGDSKETKTSIDSLLDLLNKYGKRDLTNIALELRVSPAIVESWVKILESGKLVKISYEMGKMYVSPLGKGDTEESVAENSDIKKDAIGNEIDFDKLVLEKFSERIQRLSNVTNNITTIYKQRLPEIQKVFTDLDKLYLPAEQKMNEVGELDAKFKAKLAEIDATLAKMYSKIDSASAESKSKLGGSTSDEINALLKRAELARESINQFEETKQKFYKSLDTEINQRVKEFKGMAVKSVNEIYESINLDSKAADLAIKTIKDEIASAQRMNAELKGIERDTESARKLIEHYKKDYADKRERAVHEAQAYAKIFVNDFDGAKKELQELKLEFGEAEELNRSISEIIEQVGEMKKMVEHAKNDLAEIRTQLNAVNASKTITVESREKMLNEINKKTSDVAEKIKKMNEVLTDVEFKIKGDEKSEDSTNKPDV